jgi:hypothetical protein
MARRRAVTWASGISLALVLGSGLIALGAGAFASPPVDRVGTFATINAEFTPATTRATAATTVSPRPSLGASTDPSQLRDGHPVAPADVVNPSGAESDDDATPEHASTTTTSSGDAREVSGHESSGHESPESPEHDSSEHEPDD